MNHLKISKELLAQLTEANPGGVTPEGGMFVQAFATNHALIAIAEEQRKQTLVQDRTRNHLLNIAEQLEKKNKYQVAEEVMNEWHSGLVAGQHHTMEFDLWLKEDK